MGPSRLRERGALRSWGGWSPVYAQGGGFSARDRQSSLLGSISVGPAGNRWIAVVGGFHMRERGHLKGWGSWNLGYTRGARFGARNRKSSAPRSISAGPAGNRQTMVAGAFGVREKRHLKGWGPGARYAQGGL